MMNRESAPEREDRKAHITRTTIKTGQSYEALRRAFESELNQLDASLIQGFLERGAPWSDIRTAIEEVGGARGLMILAKVDQGTTVSRSGRSKRCCLYLVGNPVIANDILDIELRGAFYVPFRVALVESDTDEGASLIYDRPSSFLGTFENRDLDQFGNMLDAKIDSLTTFLKDIIRD
jgi:uncharacterized protein (DUF302 family)